MRVIIKPLGALLLLGTLAVLIVLTLSPRANAPLSSATSATRTADIRGQQSGEPAPATIYDGQLQNGWESYGWAKVLDFSDTKHARPRQTACIRAVPDGYQAIYLHHAPSFPRDMTG